MQHSTNDTAAAPEFDILRSARNTQIRRLQSAIASGRRLVGFKTALLDPAAQARLGSPGPVWGWFTDEMQLANGAVLDCTSRPRFRAEAEIVFVLGKNLVGPGLTEADILAATAGIRAGIELPGSRRKIPPATAIDFVADNTSAAHFVLGPTLVPVAEGTTGLGEPAAVERRGWIADLTAVIGCDDEVLASGTAERVLGHPARAVAGLANALASDGLGLQAGMFIFSGAVAGPINPVPSHRYTAYFDRLGSVTFST